MQGSNSNTQKCCINFVLNSFHDELQIQVPAFSKLLLIFNTTNFDLGKKEDKCLSSLRDNKSVKLYQNE